VLAAKRDIAAQNATANHAAIMLIDRIDQNAT
jgi:hypothetical protein